MQYVKQFLHCIAERNLDLVYINIQWVMGTSIIYCYY